MSPQIYNTIPSGTKNITSPDTDATRDIARSIKEFLKTNSSVNYLEMSGVNKELQDAMRREIKKRNIVSAKLDKILQTAASLIELAYKDCTLEEKTNLALFNWFGIYVDDAATENVAPFMAFQQRFIRGLPQLDPVLDAYAAVLHRICDQYPEPLANLMLNSTFEFMTTTCMEADLEARPILCGATRFPGFIRDRTGLGIAYALMGFPKSSPTDLVTCLQALPDMCFVICAINDILSFYKEELAGETANYISNRAKAENKDSLQVFLALGTEMLEASENVTKVLSSSPKAFAAWKSIEAGMIAWHLQQDRYRLKDLQVY